MNVKSTLRLITLTIRNFMSYGNNVTTFNLDSGEVILIQGRNLDSVVDGQIDSNGAGKTTLRLAISYALFDDASDDISANEIINKINGKNTEVTLTFEKNGAYYKIERYRKTKRGNGVAFYEKASSLDEAEWNLVVDDADKTAAEKGDTTESDVKFVNRRIVEIIGIPNEIYSRINTISAEKSSFLKMKLEDQREFTEELFGFTELSKKAAVLKKEIRTSTEQMNLLVKLDEQIEEEHKRYQIQLTATQERKNNWDASQRAKITALKASIMEYDAKFGAVDFDIENAKFETLELLKAENNTATWEASTIRTALSDANAKRKGVDDWYDSHRKQCTQLEAKVNEPTVFSSIEELKAFEERVAGFDRNISAKKDSSRALETNIRITGSSLQEKKRLLARITTDITEKKKEVAQLELSKCPYCSQAYEATVSKKQEIDVQLNELVVKGTAVSKEVESLTTELEWVTGEKATLATMIGDIEKQLKEFCKVKLGTKTFAMESQKTLDRQKWVDQLELKRKEKNPFLINDSLEAMQERCEQLSTQYNSQFMLGRTTTQKIEELQQTMLFKTTSELITTKMQLANWFTDLDKLKAEQNPHADVLASLLERPPPTHKTEEIQKLHDLIEHQEFLQKLLTKKDSFIRKALISRYIPFLNSRIKEYLMEIGLPHKVEFQQDMSVRITQFKAEYKFGGISSGQKARVNLALAFAFRDVLQLRFGKINFCILDECLDVGLGNVGVQLAAKMIRSIAKKQTLSMFVISHRDEISTAFPERMMIELKNGFSNLVAA
jgi:DNA repair exonuclease SbcCD ATPase subunit